MEPDRVFLDDYVERRRTLLAAWAAWDERPGDPSRANAMEDACKHYAGDATHQFRKFVSAVRRHGGNPEEALDAWERDW